MGRAETRGPEKAGQAGMSVPKRKNTVVSAATLSSFRRSMAYYSLSSISSL